MNQKQIDKGVAMTEDLFKKVHHIVSDWVMEQPTSHIVDDGLIIAAMSIALKSNLEGKLDSLLSTSPIVGLMSSVGVKVISDALSQREEEAKAQGHCHCLMCVAEDRVGKPLASDEATTVVTTPGHA